MTEGFYGLFAFLGFLSGLQILVGRSDPRPVEFQAFDINLSQHNLLIAHRLPNSKQILFGQEFLCSQLPGPLEPCLQLTILAGLQFLQAQEFFLLLAEKFTLFVYGGTRCCSQVSVLLFDNLDPILNGLTPRQQALAFHRYGLVV